MAERIVKETLDNGNIRFRVEENTILGIPTPWWTTKIIEYKGVATAAIFPSIEEARLHLSVTPKVVNKEIVE